MLDEGTLVHGLYHLDHGATRSEDEVVREAARQVVADSGTDDDIALLAEGGWYRRVAEVVPGPDGQDPVKRILLGTQSGDAKRWPRFSRVDPGEAPLARGTSSGDIVRDASGDLHALVDAGTNACRRCQIDPQAFVSFAAGEEPRAARMGM